MTQDIQTPPVESIPPQTSLFFESVKVGLFFPFKMDKAKAMVLFEFFVLMTLGCYGFYKGFAPFQAYLDISDPAMVDAKADLITPFVYMVPSYVLILGTVIAFMMYVMQCGGLGGSYHPFLGHVVTARFWRFFLVSMLSMAVLFVFVAVMTMLVEYVSEFTLFVTIPGAIYLFGRFLPLFPHVALHNKIAVKDVWRVSQGHVFKILCVPMVTYMVSLIMAMVICFVLFFGTSIFFTVGKNAFNLGITGDEREGLTTYEGLFLLFLVALYFSCVTWLVSGIYVSLAHVWQRLLERNMQQTT